MSNRVYESRKGARGAAAKSRRRKACNRVVKNRYELEVQAEGVGTSAKKLRLSSGDYDVDFDCSFGYRILSFVSVFSALSNCVVCSKCHSKVRFSESSRQGLGFKLNIDCENCAKVTIDSCPKINNKAYEINRRLIFSMRLLGIGINGIKKFCAFMDLPSPVWQKSYNVIIDSFRTATDTVCTFSMKNGATIEKEKSDENGETNGITVSGDGSWRKRGFSSLFGVISLIGWHTGKVLDVVVKSKFCKSCMFWSGKEDTVEYDEWHKNHEPQCEANHSGSAGKMEVDGVTEMFSRANEKNGVSYVNYIGDGDCKTFTGIAENNPGVQKKECIDHVQKRLGTRLRNLAKTKKLGGKGKLTGKLIDKLSIYYGLAIRRNSHSVDEMRKAIWATLYHKMSTDKNPQHQFCPEGPKSWCGWQLRKCIGGDQNNFKHDTELTTEIFESIKGVYEVLTRDELLIRCLGGYTQNSNESFNAMVWSMAPKSVSSGKKVLDIAVNLSVIIFNDGFKGILQVMKTMGLTIGQQCYDFCCKVDDMRVKKSEKSLTYEAKLARKDNVSSRKGEEQQNLDLEGLLYGPGIAD